MTERIIRIGNFVYAKLFIQLDENYICFVDNDKCIYEGKKLFWRFYLVKKTHNG